MSRDYFSKSPLDKKTAIQRRRERLMRDEEEHLVQAKLASGSTRISSPGDAQEQEADTIARKVVDGGDANVRQLSAIPSAVQAKPEGVTSADDRLQRSLESSKSSGRSMDETTKSEMEGKMGADFSGVKIHTGSQAHEMSESIHAKAFTHGQDIYFKNGNYNPRTNDGKNLLAHELTHTVQQGGGIRRQPDTPGVIKSPLFKDVPELKKAYDGELTIGRNQDNDVGARGEFVKRINLALLKLYPNDFQKITRDLEYYSIHTKRAIKRFQKDNGMSAYETDGAVGQKTMKLLDAYYFTVDSSVVDLSKLTADKVSTKQKVGDIQFVDIKKWQQLPLYEAVLTLRSGQRFYFSETQAFEPNPVFGMFPVGKGGTQFVVTENGNAILFDSGKESATRPPMLVYEAEMNSLMERLGIERVEEIYITHLHEDHVNVLIENITRFQVRAENLYVSPLFAYKTDKSGKNLMQVLREELPNRPETRLLNYHNFEFVSKFEGATEGTQTLLHHEERGGLLISYLVSREAKENLEQKVEANKVTASIEDAASTIIRIKAIGTGFTMAILGDYRGKDFLRLYEEMGREAFGEFFRNVTLLSGFNHHLGRVNDARDLEGIQRLLEVTSFQRAGLTVAVQARDGNTQNFFAQSLAAMGIEAHLLSEGGEHIASQFVAMSNGEISSVGPGIRRFTPTPEEAEAWARFVRVENYKTALEGETELIANNPKVAELNRIVTAAYARLKSLAEARLRLTLGRAVGKTDAQLGQETFSTSELAENLTSMREPLEFDTYLEREKDFVELIDFAIEMSRRSAEIAVARESMNEREGGRELIETVFRASPRFANVSFSINLSIRYSRVIRMIQESEMQELIHNSAGATTARGRISGGFMAALMIWNDIVAPLLIANRNLKLLKNNMLSKAWDVILWWVEKGIWPDIYLIDKAGNHITEMEAILKKIKTMDVDGFYMSGIKEESWERFREWTTFNIRNFDDFNEYFMADPASAVQWEKGATLAEYKFKLRMPRGTGTSIQYALEENATLTKIMINVCNIMSRNTSIELDMLMEETKKAAQKTTTTTTTSTMATIGPANPYLVSRGYAGSPSTPVGKGEFQYKPIRRLKFKTGKSKDAFSLWDQEKFVTENSWLTPSSVVLFEITDPEKPTPAVYQEQANLVRFRGNFDESEYIRVIGGNYEAYGVLKVLEQPVYSDRMPIHMPQKTEEHWNGMRWEDKLLTPEQLSAKKEFEEDPVRVKFDPDNVTFDDSGGWIHYPGRSKNFSGMALVKKSDVEEIQ